MAHDSISHILVPTDLSEFGHIALRWGMRFRSLFDARITLLHVVDVYPPVAAFDVPPPNFVEQIVDIQAHYRDALKRHIAERGIDESAVDISVVEGPPAAMIPVVAHDIGADLLIMGTHGRRGWRRILLGSVTESVVHDIDRPLLTVRETSLVPAIVKIACPVNFTHVARCALELAVVISQKFNAQLVLIHVAEPPGEPLVEPLPEIFESWVDPIVRQRLQYTKVIRQGRAAEEVLRAVEEEKADLVVLGAEHKRFRDATVIGTTTARVLRFADSPVLTVPGRETA